MTFTDRDRSKILPAAMEPASRCPCDFLTTDAERRVLLNPELALGEVYMEGTFVVEQGSIADALAILLDQPEILPRWAKLQILAALSGQACQPSF